MIELKPGETMTITTKRTPMREPTEITCTVTAGCPGFLGTLGRKPGQLQEITCPGCGTEWWIAAPGDTPEPGDGAEDGR